MSGKFFKKIRKEARKVTKETLGDGVTVLSTLVRPRPKYCPKVLWFVLYMALFKKKSWKYLYKNI